MELTGLDLAIIAIYMMAVTLIGVLLTKRAAKSVDSYLLGGKTLPWYLLGLSNASGMFDISGTMWLVTIGFVYGLKSIWLPWLWPTFNQIFLMVFLSAWLRRSNARTGAQWLVTRFGTGSGSNLSHIVVVVFALISALGFPRLRLHRPGQVRRAVRSLGGRPAIPRDRHLGRVRAALLRHRLHAGGGLLHDPRWHDEHRPRRCSAVHDHDGLGHRRGGRSR